MTAQLLLPGKDEVENFQKEPELHHDEDALVWWKGNEA